MVQVQVIPRMRLKYYLLLLMLLLPLMGYRDGASPGHSQNEAEILPVVVNAAATVNGIQRWCKSRSFPE
ncbi:hypothetical protein DPMN_033394 [Dreissena polymorpha]|uniref:Uncharacterized protein n=1 Tax=Dreissena polymorpha TaxID=45954 RepID=A0A9D4RKX7_DREPO|nr:hypothetical protein DPMN_033394 [Dreissena polymorpha]